MIIRKATLKKAALIMAVFITLSIVPVFNASSSKATESFDESKIVSTSSYIINDVERILYELDNKAIYLTVGNSEPMYIERNVLYIALDIHGTVIAVSPKNNFIRWYNYDLQDGNGVFYPIIKSVSQDVTEYVTGVESLIFDSDNKFVIGYKTFSGESFALPSLEDMKLMLSAEDNLSIPTPRPLVTSSPTAPTPTPPQKKDTSIQNQQNTEKPSASKADTNTNTKANNKVSLVKKGSYKCLSVGGKVVSKYKLKKGVLTWKGSKKSKKVKPIKRVKQVGFIKKSKNLIYITKKGKAYTISPKGKKKTIVKKGAKKLIFKGKFVTKVKKKSGYTNVVNK